MSFANIFEVESTGNRIDLLTHKGRDHITTPTVNWWESQGWQVVLWDNTGSLPAVGRNRIIQDYKSSDREMLIMADDDITLYTHRYLTKSWLKTPVRNGVYTLNSNHKMHILMQYSRDWDHGNHHWTETHHIGQLYAIDNKLIPLQDETLPALEDMDWAWQCQALGIPTRMLHTVFLKERSQDKGSIFCKDRKQRVEIYAQAKEQMHTKWGVKNYKEFKEKYTKKEEIKDGF
jgi:hypothetical protein